MITFWLVVAVAAAYLYCRQIYSRFTNHGVKQLDPIPIIGNMASIVFRKKHVMEALEDLYKKFPEERFVGRFEFIKPVVIIRDLDLVKQVAVKDYEYFLDHGLSVSRNVDPLFGRTLFTLKGQEWKDMRSTLSPAFTSSKMKHMVPFMVEVGDQMMISLKKQLQESDKDYIDVDCKNIASRYANDVIASCAFGLRVDSHCDPDNEFYKMGLEASDFSFRQIMIFFGHSAFPWLLTKLGLTLLSERTRSFFKELVAKMMKDREEHGIIRQDMIHLLMEARKGRLTYDEKSGKDADAGFATVEESEVGKKTVKREWTDVDLTAQAVIFFIAGFETVSTAMFLTMYELAINPDIQDRLAQEIREQDKKHGGKIDFESIQAMTYLDMVVSEMLRLWPPAFATDRLCVKDYNLGRPNSKASKDYIIKAGETLQIPFAAFHYNPQYFPDPLKFDPERFSEENKHKIQPYTYTPFGVGPRNCIGSRFALCEMKVMIYQLLLHIELLPCERTPIPAQLSKHTFSMRLIGGHYLRMKLRK